MPPSCSIALSAMFCASPSTVRSPRTTATLPPCASMSAATAYVRFGCRPWIATATPSAARARAIASPKPMLLPVASARFPCNLKSIRKSPGGLVSRFAGHRQVVGSGAAGWVGAAGQAAMARPVMSAQIRTVWAVVEALVLRMLDPGHDLTLGRAIALQLVGDHSPHYQIDP